MIVTLCGRKMGKRAHANPKIRGLKIATAAVCLIRHGDGSFVCGVGIEYPDAEHLFFTEVATKDPVKLWMGMHAASRISCLSDKILESTVMIADEVVSLENSCFDNLDQCLSYGYTVGKLREEIFATKPDENDIKKIVAGLRHWELPVNDPFATQAEKEVPTFLGSLSWKSTTGIDSLSLCI